MLLKTVHGNQLFPNNDVGIINVEISNVGIINVGMNRVGTKRRG